MRLQTEQEAIGAAKILLSKMTSKGWSIEVWQNIGWCYCIKNFGMSVREYKDGKYYAHLSDDNKFGGTPVFWSDNKSYNDPNIAVRKQIEKANNFVNKLNKHLSKVYESLLFGN